MDATYAYELGTDRSKRYFFTVAVRPNWSQIEAFAVTVYYARPDGDNIEIARIDTTHGDVHFDRLYRRDQPKDFGVDVGYPEAEELLRENWRTYAAGYERVHGSGDE